MSTAIANQLYLAYLGRPADLSWRNATASILDPTVGPPTILLNAFYAAAVADGVVSASDNSETIVSKIFQNIFGFAASSFEQTAWSTLIASGAISAQTAPWVIFTSYLGATNVPPAYQQPTQSKLIALEAFTTQLSSDPAATAAISVLGSAASVLARSYVLSVSSQATAAAAIVNLATTVANVGSGLTGSTYGLTTGADVLTGTINNDQFTATDSTLTSGDSLTGGLGVDSLSVTTAAPFGVAAPSVTLSGVEKILFNFISGTLSASLLGIDTSNWTGVQTIGIKALNAAVNDSGPGRGAYFSNLQANVGVSLETVTVASNDASAIRLDFPANKLGSATANLAISLAGGVGDATNRADVAVITGGSDAFSTVSIANSGVSYLGLKAIAGVLSPTTITITGSGSLNLATSTNADYGNLTTVTASNASTAVTMDLSSAARNLTFTGGSGGASLVLGGVNSTVRTGAARDFITLGAGNDVISTGDGNDTVTVSTANLTIADTIDLGAGPRDAIIFSDVTKLNASGFTADPLSALNAVKNAEVIGSSAGVTAIDFGFFSQTVVRLTGNLTANVAATNATASSSVIELTGAGVTGANGGAAVSVSAATANSSFALELNGANGVTLSANSGSASNLALTIGANISAVTLLSTSSAASPTGLTNAVTASSSSVDNVVDNLFANSFVLIGNVDFTIGTGGRNVGGLTASVSAGFTRAVSFDASGFTGKLTLNASQSVDTIKGGSGADVIRGLGGNDSIDLSAGGSDTVVFSASGSLNGADMITGFTAGVSQDVLNVSQFITKPGALTILASLTGSAAVAANSIAVVNANAAIGAKAYGGADFGDLFAAAGSVFSTSSGANAKAVVIVQGTDQTDLLFVDAGLTGGNATIQSSDVILVGVLQGVSNASNFVIGNFA